MTRVISFSLYGEQPEYTINAVVNCLLAPKIYPGWTCRFYIDDTVPDGVVRLLRSFPHVELVEMPRHRESAAFFWRFLAAADPGIEVMVSRDADSWLSAREAACVDAWLESGRDFHIIRDHCCHGARIMGGMWGVRGGVLPEMARWVEEFCGHETDLGHFSDQRFLAERVYPLVIDKAVVHGGDSGGAVIDHFHDGVQPVPRHDQVEEAVPGLSFAEAHRLNADLCPHCGVARDLHRPSHRTHPAPGGGGGQSTGRRARHSA